MSLGIVVKGPEGLVLAAESRVTIGAELPQGQKIHVNFDNATKLLSFSAPSYNNVGVVTYGQAAIGLRTAYSFLPEFESELLIKEKEAHLSVEEFAIFFSDFFMKQWREGKMPAAEEYQGPSMSFVVGGFNEGEPYGRVFLIEIPKNPSPFEQHLQPGEFGITWGGQRQFVDRLLRGYDPVLPQIAADVLDLQPEQIQQLEQALNALQMPLPLQALPLQDCVNLAIFFIRTTIDAQDLTIGLRGVGGPIDVATITRSEGLKFVQRKKIMGESGFHLS